MRALTVEELEFVSGGTNLDAVETIIVTGTPSEPEPSGSGLGAYFTGFDPNRGGGGKVDIGVEIGLDLNKMMRDLDDSITTNNEKGAEILNQMQTLGQATINKGNTNSWSVVGTINGVRFVVTGQGSNITSVTRSGRGGTMTWQSSWGVPGGGFWRPQ
jgi:hypothetical protein